MSITSVCQFIQSELPIRFTRMAADECQFAVARTIRIKFQKIVDLRRLTIFVNAKDTDIQIVTRIFEIIGIAAVERALLFRRKDEPHVVVALIAIEMIRASWIQG